MRVRITVHEVGQKFAHCACVRRADNGRALHTTRNVPYGFHASAVKLALEWAKEHGHETEDE